MKSRVGFALMAGVLACGSAAAAEGGVVVYGTIDFAAGSARGAGGLSTLKAFDGAIDTPYWGVRDTEDLGQFGEARVILEGFFNSTNGEYGRPAPGGDTLFAREAAVEWSGSLGAIKAGRIDAPALIPTLRLDPMPGGPTLSPLFTHTFIAGLGGAGPNNETTGILGANTFTDTQWDNAIKLSLPKSVGFDASVFYEFSGAAGEPGKRNVGVNFLYKVGSFTLAGYAQDDWVCNPLGCLTVTINPATTPATVTTSANGTNVMVAEEKDWFIGGAYDFGPAKIYAGYNHYTLGSAVQPALSFEAGDFGSTSRIPNASIRVPIGGGAAILAWAQTRTDEPSGTSVHWGTTTLVYDYSLSKRTDAYAGLMQETLTAYSTGHAALLGLRHKF